MLIPRADPLDDALEDLRITGSILLHESYAAPWTIVVPGESRLRALVGADDHARVLLFHFVRRGGFELRMQGADPTVAEAADIVICSGGAHRMRRGRGAPAVPIESVLRGVARPAARAAGADATELVCGAFVARAAPLNPLFGALPPVLKVSTADARSNPLLAAAAAMLVHEVERGARHGFAATRVLEILCAETIRAHQRMAGSGHPGWFKGLADARIAAAIGLVHAAPAQRWTVATLAAAVSLSPSRFAARFRQTTGQSVMGYVAAWRANLACRLLRESRLALGQIAPKVGYESLPAFSRAFKAQLGQAPAAWRAAHLSPR